jgi:eukaryotic-like serine/threonine-protein kinase
MSSQQRQGSWSPPGAALPVSTTELPLSSETDDADSALDRLLRGAAHVSEPAYARQVGRLLLGSTLAGGRFQILRELGRGGMGVVYEAFDTERRSKIALKLIARPRPDSVYRFKNEFRALAALEHEHLVRLHELFAEEERWYYSMELVRGVAFDRFVRPDGVLSLSRLRVALTQLLEAVLAVHEAGHIHRDLKPSNVLVTDDEKVVVLDFGLATGAHPGGIGQTISEHAISGTPAYMAPEQAAGRRVSAASDLYAIGVMLFEALVGRLPFEGSPGELIAAKQRDDPPSLAADLPADLTRLAQALLRRDPHARPSAREALLTLGRSVATRSTAQSLISLVGRERELTALRDAYEQSRSGEQGVVLTLDGESGVGKSALCAAFLREQQADAIVLAGRCYERECVPFNVFDPLLDATTRILRRMREPAQVVPDDAHALTRLFPVLQRVPVFAHALPQLQPSPHELQRRAFTAFGDLLAKLAERAPVIVLVDDLQWADADSLALLEYLLCRPLRVLWILSQRDGATAVERVLAACRESRALRFVSLPLAPLGTRATEQLVRALVEDGAVKDELVRQIVEGSAGSPFLALQLTRHVRRAGGSYALEGSTFESALSQYLQALPPTAARLLAMIAFAGAPLLARVALAAADASYDALELLERERLVRRGASRSPHRSDKLLDCYHDRIRESVVASLTCAQKRALAERLSNVLAALDEHSSDLLRRCLAAAGDIDGALELARAAAARAATALAFDRAAELLVEALSWLGAHERAHLALIESAAVALENAGRGAESAALYRSAARLVPERRLELEHLAARQLIFSGKYLEGMALLAEVCGELGIPVSGGSSSDELAFVLTTLQLRASKLTFRPREGHGHSLKLDVAESLARALLNYRPGLPAVVAAQNHLRLSLAAGDLPHVVRAVGLNTMVQALNAPESAWSVRLMRRFCELAAEVPANPLCDAYVSGVRGVVAHNAGEFEQADRLLTECVEALERVEGMHYALDSLRWYKQRNQYAVGKLADVISQTPAAINEAFRRGRVWLGAALTGPTGIVTWLAADDVDSARRRVDEARQRWGPSARPLLPDLLLLQSQAAIDLYEGRATLACELIKQHVPALVESMKLRRSHPEFILGSGALACAGLSCERAGSTRRGELRAELAHAAARLRRARANVRHLAHGFEAVLALDRGASADAVDHWQWMLASPHCVTTSLYATATRFRLGQLLQGDAGRALISESTLALRAAGVRNIEASVRLWCPGGEAR